MSESDAGFDLHVDEKMARVLLEMKAVCDHEGYYGRPEIEEFVAKIDKAFPGLVESVTFRSLCEG